MGIAFLIVLFVFCLCALRMRTCIRRSKVPDGNIEGFGVFIYGPACMILGFIDTILGLLWLCGVGR